MAKPKKGQYQFQFFGWLIPINVLVGIFVNILTIKLGFTLGLLLIPIIYIFATLIYGRLLNKDLKDKNVWINSAIIYFITIILEVIAIVILAAIGLYLMFQGFSNFLGAL